MRELLSAKDKRLLSIIEFCIKENSTTLGAISEATNISVRTISSYIPIINSLIVPCTLISDNSGIKLSIPVNMSSRFILNTIMKNSFEMSLLEAIFKNPNHTITEASEMYYFSEITIRRTITNLNRTLKKHGFKISTHNLKFIGNIDAMHLFFIVFFSEKYIFIDEFMSEEEVLALSSVLDSLDFINDFVKTKHDYLRVLSWMYVKTLTFKNYEVTSSKKYSFEIINSVEANTLFSKAFNIPLTNELLNYWFSFIAHGFYVTNMNDALKICELDSKTSILFNKIDKFLAKIVLKHSVTLGNYDNLFIEIFNKLRFPNKYSFILYSRDSSFVKSISDDIPTFYKSVYDSLKEVFKDTLTNQDEQALMYIVFTHWSHLFVSVNMINRNIKVGIFTDSNIEHSQMISDVINSHFKKDLNTIIIESLCLTSLKEEMNTLDVLITNVPGLTHDKSKIICFSEYPTKYDWREIYSVLNTLIFDYQNTNLGLNR